MINPKACDPQEDEEVSDDKDQQKPFACLKKRDGESYCGRQVNEGHEYVFNDAAYALQHYRRGRTIAVCNKCAVRAEAQGVGALNFQPPMALRGLKDNNK
jgi:hypothetical protein